MTEALSMQPLHTRTEFGASKRPRGAGEWQSVARPKREHVCVQHEGDGACFVIRVDGELRTVDLISVAGYPHLLCDVPIAEIQSWPISLRPHLCKPFPDA
jgi:hypothetical protein